MYATVGDIILLMILQILKLVAAVSQMHLVLANHLVLEDGAH